MAATRPRRKAPAKPALRMSALLGLQKVDLFKGLDSYSLREIAAQCKWTRCKRNQYVIRRDGTDRDVYFVIAGQVRVAARGRARPAHHLPRPPGGRGVRRALGDRRPRALRRRGRAARIAARLDVAGSVPRHPRQPRLGARAPAAPPDRLGARARRAACSTSARSRCSAASGSSCCASRASPASRTTARASSPRRRTRTSPAASAPRARR